LTSFSQNYVKLKYDENIDFTEQNSFIIGFEYNTKKGKIKQRGKYFDKSGYLGRINLAVLGGEYYESSGKVYIDFVKAQKNNNEVVFIYNHPFNRKIQKKDTLRLPSLIGLKMENSALNNLYRNLKYEMNLKATFSNGKSKIISENSTYTFLEQNEITLEVIGANRSPQGCITPKTIKENSENNFVTVKYASKNSDFIESVDSFKIHKLLDINILPCEISYNTINKITAIASFENGRKEEFSGEKLQKILEGYNISISVKNGEIIDGHFASFPFSENNSGIGEIILNSDNIENEYLFPLKLDKSYDYSFGANKTSHSRHGEHGKHGDNVTIVISKITSKKEVFKVDISSVGKTETIYLNPKLGNLTIESIGSNGAQGRKGRDGRCEYENSKATRGEDGGYGGDGGDGGNINIHLPKSFGKFVNKIKIKNCGGSGGIGGIGGSGGLIDEDSNDDSSSFWGNILVSMIQKSPRMNSGNTGKNGKQGRNGEINFIYY